jgi:uncharacterized membrane protein YgaE (UPF0421/DUF939 family)
VRDRLSRLVDLLPAVAQTAVAAALAWLLARELFGHTTPFVAPVAAITVLGLTVGQQARRAVEVAVGVALGILVADAIVIALGGGTPVIALVIGLAMTAAILLGGGRTVISQAAVSAAIVATIEVPDTFTPSRALDALTGGTVALAFGIVLFPVDPVRLARRAAEPLLAELHGVLEDVAAGLEDRDRERALDALARARDLDGLVARLAESASVAGEVARQAPLRRRRRLEVDGYARLATHVDLAVRNVRVLARGAVRAVETDAHVPEEDVRAVRRLADAACALHDGLDAPGRLADAREAALQAAAAATHGLERTGNLSATHLVGQIRMTATDLLRALGVEGDAARAAVRRAAARRG